MQVPTRGVSVLWQIAPDLGSYSSERALSQLLAQKPQTAFTGLESRCPAGSSGWGLPSGLFSFRWPGTLGLWSRHSSLFPGSHRASPRLCAKSLRTPVTALRVRSDNQGHLPTLRSSAQSHPQSPFLQAGSQHRFWDKDPTSLGHSHPTQVGHGCRCRKGLAVPSSDPAQFGEQVTFQP